MAQCLIANKVTIQVLSVIYVVSRKSPTLIIMAAMEWLQKWFFMRKKLQPFIETIRRAAVRRSEMELTPFFEELGLPPE